MYNNENIFSKRLREEREELGLMQKEMAQKLNIPANTYNGYETGKRSPSLDVVRHIADTLNISTDFLLGRTAVKLNDEHEIIDDERVAQLAKKIKDLDEKTQRKVFKMIDTLLEDE